jgi:hypothetical protein
MGVRSLRPASTAFSAKHGTQGHGVSCICLSKNIIGKNREACR